MLSRKPDVLRAANAATLRAVYLLLAVFAVAIAAGSARADDYRLLPMDKIHITVAEWQTAQGAFRDWSAVNGDYTVGPAGKLSFPFIGSIKAAGKTASELATAIGSGLQDKLGLLDLPSAAVEMVAFQPVFLAGDVQTPGKYAYEPGLTVLKAVSLAGGLRRADNSGQRYERDFIKAQGDYEIGVQEQDRLLATKARLLAQMGGKSSIDVPKALAKNADFHSLIAGEQAIMQPMDKQFHLQTSQLGNLRTLLQNEIAALAQKSVTRNHQLDLARKDLKQVGSLADKGLTVNSRLLTVEQQVADLESKVLDIDTASLQAKQDMNKAEQDETALNMERATNLATQLNDTNAQLDKIARQIAVSKGLMLEAATKAGEAANGAGAVTVKYTVVRQVGGKATSLQANENTAVQPGDVIRVAFDIAPS